MQGRTYRYFDGEPLYAFGYGLSYTQFKYSELKLDNVSVTADQKIQVSVNVKNVGKRTGDEVVQLYMKALDAKHARAHKDLRGVVRINLKPGETRRVSFTLLPSHDLVYYDDSAKAYAVDPGKYQVQLGGSSADIRVQTELVVRQ